MSKRRQNVAAVVAVVFFGVAFGQVKPGQAAGTVRVSDRVVGPTVPIRHEEISLKLTGKGEATTTQTDEDGYFSFPSVRPDRHYDLAIDVTGYDSQVMGVQVGRHDTDLGTFVLTPPRPVSISGRLVDFTATPMPNQTVTLSGNGQNSIAAQTGQNGNFSLPPVPPDQRYSLRIEAAGLNPTAIDIDAEKLDVDVGVGNIVIQPTSPVNRPPDPLHIRRISARVTDTNGVPEAGRTLEFGSPDSRLSILKTNRNGYFIFPAVTYKEYRIFDITEHGVPVPLGLSNVLKEVGRIEISQGPDVDLGNIALLRSSSKSGPIGDIVCPVTTLNTKTVLIAAIFVGAGGASIVYDDGQVVHLPKEKAQVGCSALRISEDRTAVGWLVDSDFCCTSYPLQLMLVVYRPGEPLHRFTGDGRAVFGWQFVRGGTQVATYQDYPHGTPVPHYELRDIATERLLGKWDSDLTPKAPSWAQRLKQ